MEKMKLQSYVKDAFKLTQCEEVKFQHDPRKCSKVLKFPKTRPDIINT